MTGKKKILKLEFECPSEHLGFDEQDYQILATETIHFFGALVQRMIEIKQRPKKPVKTKGDYETH